MRLRRRRDPLEYKQPQEIYCSNDTCFNMTVEQTQWYDMLDDYGRDRAKYYCLDCIVEGNSQ